MFKDVRIVIWNILESLKPFKTINKILPARGTRTVKQVHLRTIFGPILSSFRDEFLAEVDQEAQRALGSTNKESIEANKCEKGCP